jgi:crossover junction endodeoxyribonuclease RuvC
VSTCVLGIDPGTAVTGYGVIEPSRGRAGRLIECGVIRTDDAQPLGDRLDTLFEGVTTLIARHHPEAVAVESVFYAKNVRTTVTLGHARGVILLAAARAGVPVSEFTPATVKKNVVGNGRAAKAQVGFMVQKLLNLATPPSPDDAADGVALALTLILTGGVTR